MNAKIKQQIMLQAVKIQKHVNDEIKIEFQSDGIHFKSVDPSHTELLLSFIPKHSIDEYSLGNTIEIGIDIDKLRDFLKLGKKEDIFTFDYDLDSHRLIVKLGYLTRTMGLIDIEHIEDSKIPPLKLGDRVLVNTKMFYDSLKNVLYELVEEYGIESTIVTYDKTGETEDIDIEVIIKKRFKQVYDSAYLTIQQDRIVLENLSSFDEDKDRKNRDSIIADTGILTVISGNNIETAFSDEILKHLSNYKKYWEQITIETDYYHPIKISGDNGKVQFEYWRAPCISDDIDRKRFEETQKETVVKEEVKTKKKAAAQVGKKIEPKIEKPIEPLIAVQKKLDKRKQETDIYADRESICKPKQLEYEKHQWTYAMEEIKDVLERHFSHKRQGFFTEITCNKGFVFFAADPRTDKEVSDKQGENIIENMLPEGFVLIAWYRYRPEKWIAQTVKKAT